MQEVPVEDHGRASRELDRDRLTVLIREMVSLRGASTAVVDLAFGVDDPVAVRPRYDPQAAVLGSGVVTRSMPP